METDIPSLSENPIETHDNSALDSARRWQREHRAALENSIGIFRATVERVNRWEAELATLDFANDAELLDLYRRAKVTNDTF